MLRDSTVAVVRTRPRAIPLAMITMSKINSWVSFDLHIWDAYGAPLKIENCRLLFTTNTNIFSLLFQELKTEGKTFIFAVCRLT